MFSVFQIDINTHINIKEEEEIQEEVKQMQSQTDENFKQLMELGSQPQNQRTAERIEVRKPQSHLQPEQL